MFEPLKLLFLGSFELYIRCFKIQKKHYFYLHEQIILISYLDSRHRG